jgi:hypothetical protein
MSLGACSVSRRSFQPLGDGLGALALAGAFLLFALGVKGSGGIFRSCRRTSSSLGVLDMGHALEPTATLPEHYHAFGRIAQAFVGCEVLYGHIIARITNSDDGNTFFLLSGTSYDGRRQLIKTIINELPEPHKTVGSDLVEKINDKAVLRNNVAHNGWMKGKRAESIKPIVMKAKGRLITLGISHNEKDWLAAELHAEADEILTRTLALGMFFQQLGVQIGPYDGEDQSPNGGGS